MTLFLKINSKNEKSENEVKMKIRKLWVLCVFCENLKKIGQNQSLIEQNFLNLAFLLKIHHTETKAISFHMISII